MYAPAVVRLVSFWLVMAVAGAWWGTRHLDVEVDILSLLPAQAREVQGLKLLRSHFETQNDLLILIEAPDAEKADAVVDELKKSPALVQIVREQRVLNGTTDLDQAGALLSWILINAPESDLRKLLERMEPASLKTHLDEVVETLATSPDIATVQRWSYDPLGITGILETDNLSAAFDSGMGGTMDAVRLVRLLPKEPISHYKEALNWLAEVRKETSRAATGQGATVEFTGEIVFMAEAGGGMEKDLSSTISVSMGLIGLLFGYMYRRVIPLLWITLLLAIVLGITLGLGTLVLGRLNAMNLGFAAIVLGLVVDYGVLIYQETLGIPEGDVSALRSRVRRSIYGASVSTAAVFLVLCLSQFSGLRELGLLVGIGVAVGAVVMVTTFPAIAMRYPIAEASVVSSREQGSWIPTVIFCLVSVGSLLVLGMPGFDGSSAPMRPKKSEAMATLGKLEKLGMGDDSARVPLIAVSQSIDEMRGLLNSLPPAAAGRAADHWLPIAFMPNAVAQAGARPLIEKWVATVPAALIALNGAGFERESGLLTEAVVRSLKECLKVSWPLSADQSPAGDLLQRFFSVRPDEVALLGWANPGAEVLKNNSFYSPTWAALGDAISRIAIGDAMYRMLPIALVILLVLFVVLGSWREVVLALAAMAAGFVALFGLMSLLGQEWNLMSIAALVLLTGTAEDYSIHMLIALRREGGDIGKVRATTGRAVIFCALSSCIGFVSLTFASNGGIASLGLACALGLGAMMIVSVYLLPVWWLKWCGNPRST